MQEHDRVAQEQEAAKQRAAETEAAVEATRALATAAVGILSCPLPLPGAATTTQPRSKHTHAIRANRHTHPEPPPSSRWPGGVTDALEDEDIAAAFADGVNGRGGKIGAVWFAAGRNGSVPAGRSGVSNFSHATANGVGGGGAVETGGGDGRGNGVANGRRRHGDAEVHARLEQGDGAAWAGKV